MTDVGVEHRYCSSLRHGSRSVGADVLSPRRRLGFFDRVRCCTHAGRLSGNKSPNQFFEPTNSIRLFWIQLPERCNCSIASAAVPSHHHSGLSGMNSKLVTPSTPGMAFLANASRNGAAISLA
jgi:hypothetical protein